MRCIFLLHSLVDCPYTSLMTNIDQFEKMDQMLEKAKLHHMDYSYLRACAKDCEGEEEAEEIQGQIQEAEKHFAATGKQWNSERDELIEED